MVYFIDVDEAGNILHACACPVRTVIPLVPQIKFHDNATKQAIKSSDGRPASHYGHAMVEPVGIDGATFDLINGRLENFKWDGRQVIAR